MLKINAHEKRVLKNFKEMLKANNFWRDTLFYIYQKFSQKCEYQNI